MDQIDAPINRVQKRIFPDQRLDPVAVYDKIYQK